MNTTTSESHTPRGPFFWPVLGIVVAAMFLVEHDMRASLVFQTMTNATSLEQLDAEGAMFAQSSGRQLGGLILGVLGVIFILQRGRQGRANSGLLAGWLLLFFAWALLSVTWAGDPGLTARRLVLFGCMGVGAWALATRFSPREIAALALAGPLVYLVAGIYAEYANGTLAFTTPGYRFAGTVHPNAQAINCAILFLAAFYFVRTTQRRRWFFVAVLALALVMLYMTKSRTALASTVVAVVGFEALLLTGPRRMAVMVGGAASVVALFLLSSVLLPAVQDKLTLGRTDVSEDFGTLTGRWPLWTQLTGFVAERPVLGYGYGGFWNYDNSMEVIEEQGWPISHAHNAYLDTMLELGPVGLLALVVALLLGLRLAYLARMRSGDRGYEFLGLVLAFGMLNGCLESQIIQRTFLTLLVMMTLAHVARHATASVPLRAPVPTPPADRPAGALAISREGGR
jgi:exopolysaccharide production protein ExoQ